MRCCRRRRAQHHAPHRPPGLYEELITHRLEAAIEEGRLAGLRDEIAELDQAEVPRVLARFVHDLVEPLLGSFSGSDRTAHTLPSSGPGQSVRDPVRRRVLN